MALPSSGTLSINDIVGEFGGSAPHSLSEYYRGGNFVPDSATNSDVPTSGQINISDFYGAASQIWDTTVTVGSGAVFGATAYGYTRYFYTVGNISDNTVDFLSGATLLSLYYSYPSVIFTVSGLFSNTGFSSIDIDGTSLNRTDASFSNPQGLTSWNWNTGFTNPFGTTIGATKLVTFS